MKCEEYSTKSDQPLHNNSPLLITRRLKSKQIYFDFQSLSQKTVTLITIKSSLLDPENTDRVFIPVGDYAMLPDFCVNSRRLFLQAMMSLSEQ